MSISGLTAITCPVCKNEAEAFAYAFRHPRDFEVHLIICDKCGFQWHFSEGDLSKCAKEYIESHPINSCLAAL